MDYKQSPRIAYYDNAKFILIVLVVIGHAIDGISSTSSFAKSMFLFIYTFHMPVFIFLAGFFSKNIMKSAQKAVSKIIYYFILYIFLRVGVFLITKYYFNKPNLKLNFFIVSDLTWYFLALVIWITILFIINVFKWQYTIPALLITSILAGFDSSIRDYMCLSRVIVFAPFFYGGFYIKKDILEKFYLVKTSVKAASVGILLIILFIININNDNIYFLRPLFTGRNPYAVLKFPEYGMALRILCYIISIFLGIIFLLSVPAKKYFFTNWGQRTLTVYVLHIFPYIIYSRSRIGIYLVSQSSYWKIGIVLLAILTAVILSSSFLNNIFLEFFDRLQFLLKKLSIKEAAQ